MSVQFVETGLNDLLDDFARKVLEDVNGVTYDDLVAHHGRRVVDVWKSDLIEEYGQDVESNFSQSNVIQIDKETTSLSAEEIESAIEAWENRKESDLGRPSKTEKWAARIQSGDATLEEAKDALAQSTFYKMKREFDL